MGVQLRAAYVRESQFVHFCVHELEPMIEDATHMSQTETGKDLVCHEPHRLHILQITHRLIRSQLSRHHQPLRRRSYYL